MRVSFGTGRTLGGSRKVRVIKWIVSSLLLFAGVAFLFGVLWVRREFDDVGLDLLLFQLAVSNEGANVGFVPNLLLACLPPAALIVAACWLLLGNWFGRDVVLSFRFRGKERQITLYPFWFVKRHVLPVSSVLAVALAVVSLLRLGIVDVMTYLFADSKLIEQEYVDPRTVGLTFPEEKKNLIYIYLESLETSFMSTEEGGIMEENLTPELTLLAEEYIHFSNTDQLGGALHEPKAGWTVAAHVAQTSGMPMLVPTDAYNNMSKYGDFLPGLYSLGDILEAQGYNQTYLIGSRATYGSRQQYFTQHGNFTIKDYRSAPADGIIEEGYNNKHWGMEDKYLYEYAKQQLLDLAAREEPFNLTMLTVDTHFPSGFKCDLCPDGYPDKLSGAVACASRQAYDFVTWLSWQDFYEDTVVVIAGDHLYMGNYFKDVDSDYTRTTYNAFINAAAATDRLKNRQFTNFDLFPTTLAAMGVTIEGDRLGIGTNLFSAADTLAERIGIQKINNELARHSKFYNKHILGNN